MYKRLYLSSVDEWRQVEDKRRLWKEVNSPPLAVQQHNEFMAEREIKREQALIKFPYSVVLVGSYDEHDYVARWLWRNIGERNCEICDDCGSTYASCPLVLAVEYNEEGYKEVEKHGHSGPWTSVWLGKIGYDYGYGEYCFLNEKDKDCFVDVIDVLKCEMLVDDNWGK